MYNKKIIYAFVVDGIEYQIVNWNADLSELEIKETQNEAWTRRSGAIVVRNIDADSGCCELIYAVESITDYESKKHAANVLSYLNTNRFVPE